MAQRMDVPRDRAVQDLTNLLSGIPSPVLSQARDRMLRHYREAHTRAGTEQVRKMYNMVDDAYREALRNESVKALTP